jgi:hypothetical protein
MTKQIVIAAALCACSTVFAQAKSDGKPKPADKPAAAAAPAGAPPADMAPPKPGAETKALEPFAKSVTWTGKVPAGAMMPGMPEMPSKGKATCKWIINGLWSVCDLEDNVGTGKQAMKWQGHMVSGWDFGAKEYRGTMVDNWGISSNMKGKLDGAKLTWESMGEIMMMGQPTKIRITMDATDPKAIKFTGEHTVKGAYVVDEETVMKPAGK